MDIHMNARLTVHGRERMVRLLEGGQVMPLLHSL